MVDFDSQVAVTLLVDEKDYARIGGIQSADFDAFNYVLHFGIYRGNFI